MEEAKKKPKITLTGVLFGVLVIGQCFSGYKIYKLNNDIDLLTIVAIKQAEAMQDIDTIMLAMAKEIQKLEYDDLKSETNKDRISKPTIPLGKSIDI